MDSEAVALSHLKVIERVTEIQTTSRIYASPTNNNLEASIHIVDDALSTSTLIPPSPSSRLGGRWSLNPSSREW